MEVIIETPAQYLEQLQPEKREVLQQLREVISENLPDGFMEAMSYGSIGYVVPHSLYPPGYHCKPNEPLPFISIASQKHSVTIHHMGLYADTSLAEWFGTEYPNYSSSKIDMGKGSIRFKKLDQIPFELIGKLAAKLNPRAWIEMYEAKLKR